MNPNWRRNYQRYRAYLFHAMEHYKSRKELRSYLELLLSLATIVLFSILALKPTLLTITDLFRQIESKKQIVIELDKKIEDVNLARQIYSSQQSNINLLNESIPNNSNPQQILKQVEGLKSKHLFQLITLSIGESDIKGESVKPDENGNFSVPYSVNSRADYENLYRLLNDVERLRRPNVIDSLVFTRSKVDESIILVVNANAFYFKDSNPISLPNR